MPYFDLSLQHASRPMLRAMRRWGDADRFLERIAAIRAAEPDATFRSSFILGYPGETEDDQRALLDFIEEAQLDWAGFFTFSSEEGTYANDLARPGAARARARATARGERVAGRHHRATPRRPRRHPPAAAVDSPGVGRSVRECPEIDGIVMVDASLSVGTMVECEIVASHGTDLEGVRV